VAEFRPVRLRYSPFPVIALLGRIRYDSPTYRKDRTMKTVSAAALLLAALMAVQAQADLRYKVQTKTEGGPKSQGATQVMQMTAAGDNARMEFLEGGPVQNGGYILSKDGGKTMVMVNTKDKTYMNWDMEAMMGMAGAMGSMMKMEVTNPKMEKLLDEAGQPILGYPTRHYKFRISYGMSMTVMGFSSSSDIVREEETWTTTRIDTAALMRWFKNAPKINESLDKLIAMERGRMEGMPLKMLSVQTSTDKKGKVQTTKTSMDVTEIEKMTADPRLFQIPEEYKEMKMGGDESGEADGAAGKDAPPAGLPGFLKMMRK
jgi:hypothetical protein